MMPKSQTMTHFEEHRHIVTLLEFETKTSIKCTSTDLKYGDIDLI